MRTLKMMCLFTAMCVTTMSLALPALAQEKSLDSVNIKPGKAGFQMLPGTFDASSPTYDRIYGNDVDAACGAPMLDSANNGMAFDIFCIEVTDSAPVEIIVDPTLTTISDTVLTLYCDPFDPMAPALNVVAYDDDDGMGTLSALTASDDIRLVPGREYWVVVSTYGAGMYGSFTVQLSDNAAPCGGVAVDGATWGDLKGMYR
ncbi:MAG: hypothetical protein IPI48_02680 [bacterium]|nr:hypothetical protein [bacterium]